MHTKIYLSEVTEVQNSENSFGFLNRNKTGSFFKILKGVKCKTKIIKDKVNSLPNIHELRTVITSESFFVKEDRVD